MTEGPIHIWMAYKEPENKEILWLRPYLDREGYELLFYGAKGWTPFCLCNAPSIKYPGYNSTDCTKYPQYTEDLEICEEDPCECE